MRNIILNMLLLTLVSSNNYLKREVLPEESDDDIILQKGTEHRFHSSSIYRSSVKPVKFNPKINPPKIIKNPGVNEKLIEKGNKNNPHHRGSLLIKKGESSKPTNDRPKKPSNEDIHNPNRFIRLNKPPTQGLQNNIFRPVKPRL